MGQCSDGGEERISISAILPGQQEAGDRLPSRLPRELIEQPPLQLPSAKLELQPRFTPTPGEMLAVLPAVPHNPTGPAGFTE